MDRDVPAPPAPAPRECGGAPYGDALGVVAVTRSPGEALDRFLDSLKAATAQPVDVVVADLGSTDGAPERAAARDGVRLLRIGEDVGRAAGTNRGTAELGPDIGWVVAADTGVEWAEGALDDLLAAGRRWPRAGALGPLVRGPGGAAVSTARPLPDPVRAALATVAGRGERGGPAPTAAPAEGPAERPVGWLDGSCLLVRRQAFDSVDGFDPRYTGSHDDVDLGDRLARAGWLSVFVPSAEVVRVRPPAPVPDGRHRYLVDRLRGRRHAPLRAALAVRARAADRRPAGPGPG